MDANSKEETWVGQPGPVFTLADLDGQPHSLADDRGRIVILNFWSAECPYAKRVDQLLIPWLATQGAGVALLPLACNANESLELLRTTAAQRGLPPVLWDEHHHLVEAYGAVTTPHFFVLDGQGIVRYQGAYDDVSFRQQTPTRFYLPEAVEALRAGRLPEVAQTQPYGCAIVRWSESE